MDIRIAHSLFQVLQGDRFALIYSGAFHDEHTAQLIALAEAALDGLGVEGNVRSRFAFIMVEAYQNIIRHRSELAREVAEAQGRSLFFMRGNEAGQHVVAINAVLRSKVEALERSLADVNGKDGAQLKELFLAGLQRASDPHARGAGLGLIEMARRSGSELGYLLRGLGPEHALFVLAVRLGAAISFEGIIDHAAVLHGTVVQQAIRLCFVGHASPAIDDALLHVVEKEEQQYRQDGQCARAHLAGRDLMTTICGPRHHGVFVLCEGGSGTALTFGAVMSSEQAAALVGQVQECTAWDSMRLERHYRDALLGRGTQQVPLGLVELARASSEPVVCITLPVSGGTLGLVQAVV